MVDDDVLFRFRLRLFSLAAELGNVREACRIFGVHPSTYYRWRGPVLRSGLEMLRPSERRPPRMPNQTSQLTEQRVIAFALGHPGLGPAADQRHPRPGALGRHRDQPQRRVAGAPPPRPSTGGSAGCRWSPATRPRPGPSGRPRSPRATSRSSRPGELVGFDCFHVGRLSGTAGRVWQYTAIDLASSYVWAELATTPLNPSAARTERPRATGRRRPRCRTAGAWSGCSPTTGASSAPGSSATRSAGSARPRRSSGPAVRPPTARSSGSSGRSSRSAGGRRSRGAWCPSSRGSSATSRRTLATTTTSAPTPGGSRTDRTPAEVIHGGRKMRPR